MSLPTKTGYYWAKLKTPSGGNFYCAGLPQGVQGIRIEPEMDEDEQCSWASTDWEIVEVWDNNGDTDEERFGVNVPGIPITQWPLDFFWGPEVKDRPPS